VLVYAFNMSNTNTPQQTFEALLAKCDANKPVVVLDSGRFCLQSHLNYDTQCLFYTIEESVPFGYTGVKKGVLNYLIVPVEYFYVCMDKTEILRARKYTLLALYQQLYTYGCFSLEEFERAKERLVNADVSLLSLSDETFLTGP
jgi:hypothetical protein